ncbi:MAG: hypothetical protein Q7R83_01650 [bacterium]|nr:hypothetical protein [bacterium]
MFGKGGKKERAPQGALVRVDKKELDLRTPLDKTKLQAEKEVEEAMLARLRVKKDQLIKERAELAEKLTQGNADRLQRWAGLLQALSAEVNRLEGIWRTSKQPEDLHELRSRIDHVVNIRERIRTALSDGVISDQEIFILDSVDDETLVSLAQHGGADLAIEARVAKLERELEELQKVEEATERLIQELDRAIHTKERPVDEEQNVELSDRLVEFFADKREAEEWRATRKEFMRQLLTYTDKLDTYHRQIIAWDALPASSDDDRHKKERKRKQLWLEVEEIMKEVRELYSERKPFPTGKSFVARAKQLIESDLMMFSEEEMKEFGELDFERWPFKVNHDHKTILESEKEEYLKLRDETKDRSWPSSFETPLGTISFSPYNSGSGLVLNGTEEMYPDRARAPYVKDNRLYFSSRDYSHVSCLTLTAEFDGERLKKKDEATAMVFMADLPGAHIENHALSRRPLEAIATGAAAAGNPKACITLKSLNSSLAFVLYAYALGEGGGMGVYGDFYIEKFAEQKGLSNKEMAALYRFALPEWEGAEDVSAIAWAATDLWRMLYTQDPHRKSYNDPEYIFQSKTIGQACQEALAHVPDAWAMRGFIQEARRFALFNYWLMKTSFLFYM